MSLKISKTLLKSLTPTKDNHSDWWWLWSSLSNQRNFPADKLIKILNTDTVKNIGLLIGGESRLPLYWPIYFKTEQDCQSLLNILLEINYFEIEEDDLS